MFLSAGLDQNVVCGLLAWNVKCLSDGTRERAASEELNYTGPPRNGEPQTGQSLGQKMTPNASGISHTSRAKSTLRRYAQFRLSALR